MVNLFHRGQLILHWRQCNLITSNICKRKKYICMCVCDFLCEHVQFVILYIIAIIECQNLFSIWIWWWLGQLNCYLTTKLYVIHLTSLVIWYLLISVCLLLKRENVMFEMNNIIIKIILDMTKFYRELCVFR